MASKTNEKIWVTSCIRLCRQEKNNGCIGPLGPGKNNGCVRLGRQEKIMIALGRFGQLKIMVASAWADK